MVVICNSAQPLQFYNQIGVLECQSLKLILSAGDFPHTTIDVPRSKCNSGSVLIKNFDETTLISNYKNAVIELSSLMPENIPLSISESDRQILQHFIKHIQPHFENTVLYSNPREGYDLLIESLAYLENVFAKCVGSYFGGSQPNIVDFGLFPYIDKIGTWTHAMRPGECRRLQAWIKVMRQHPAVMASALSEDELKVQLQEYSQALRDRS